MGSVHVSLWKDGIHKYNIAMNEKNDREDSWRIPISQEVGSDYKVRVMLDNNVLSDASDDYFEIRTSLWDFVQNWITTIQDQITSIFSTLSGN